MDPEERPRLCPGHRAAGLWVALAVAFWVGCAGTDRERRAESSASVPKHVVMISIDGLIPAYYTTPRGAEPRIPNLERLARLGAHARGVEGVYPSVTFPSHTTLVTGVLPAVHGIVNNRVFVPPTDVEAAAWYWFADSIQSDTLWAAAGRAGLVTGSVAWPATAGAMIDYNVPEIWAPSERVYKFSTPGLFEEAFGGEDGHGIGTDDDRAELAITVIRRHRPNLVLIHLMELDIAHHEFGPWAPEALKAMEQIDGHVGRLVDAVRVAGILEETAFVIVSDHGFARITQTFEPNVVLAREGLITLDASGVPGAWVAASWPAAGACGVVLRDPADRRIADAVTALFERVLQRPGGPLRRILERDELDRLGAMPEAFLMLEAADGYACGGSVTGPEIHPSGEEYRGTHGYLPTWPQMHASLIMYGAGVRSGARVELARMIDVAPTVAALLAFPMPEAAGVPIRAFIQWNALLE